MSTDDRANSNRNGRPTTVRFGKKTLQFGSLNYPDGMDSGDVLKKHGPGSLLKLAREAEAQFETAAEPKVTPAPSTPSASDESTVSTARDRIVFTFGDRSYEVDALAKNRAPGSLSVTIHARRGGALFADRIELYTSKDRERFVRACAAGIEVDERIIAGDLSRMHEELRHRQDELLAAAEKPKPARVVPQMGESERRAALELLRSPKLTELIVEHFRESGYVGEELNLLTGYIVCTSRLLRKPLHVLFQSSTAAGKTTLLHAVVEMVPPEEVFGYSGISSKGLRYMQDRDLRHCLFILEEDKRLDEEARELIKNLKTQGRVSSLITVRDPETGMMRAEDFHVEGPLAFLMTTTILVIDEEQINRDMVCSADESRAQTARIQEMQRLLCTLEGQAILDRRAELQRLHQNAQRLLRPVTVLNPYARQMQFPEFAHRLRRDHQKYIALIEAVTFLHQYQRPLKTRMRADGTIEEYIETTFEDIEIANRIAVEILGQSIDECPPHTRTLLAEAGRLVDELAQKQGIERDLVRITARELADRTGLSVSMVNRHLNRLIELHYVYPDEARRSRFQRYGVAYQDTGASRRFLAGLLDTEALKRRIREAGR